MRLFGPISAVLVLVPGAVSLGADTVELVNGDRLTGTVRRLEDGVVVLQSELLGTLDVDWDKIRSIDSDAMFSVLTSDGDSHYGTLARDGSTTTVGPPGRPAIGLPSESIERAVPQQPRSGVSRFLTGLEGSADLGHSLAGGNQHQTQSSLGATADYESARFRFSARLDSLFARQDGARSQSRHALNTRLVRFSNSNLFTYGLSALERNERRLLDIRSRFGGGLGWRLLGNDDTRFATLGGFALVHEELRDIEDRTSGEAFAGLEWEAQLFGKVEVEMRLTVHSDLADRDRVRAEYDGTLRIPIAKRLSYSLRLFDRYDTRPASTVERNDYGIVSGLGVEF